MVKKCITILLTAFLLLTTVVMAPVYGEEESNKTAYENNFSKLYELVPGMQSRMSSSHDLTGGNADGFCLTDTVTKDEIVILEAEGPGVVNRIFIGGWAEHMNQTTLYIYIDGSDTPVVSGGFTSFYNGSNALMPKPWFGTGGGGVYSHLPIYFQESIKITQTYASYYDIDYTLFPSDYQVTSFGSTGEADIPNWYATEVGENPNMGTYESVTKTISLTSGSTDIYQADGPGVVRGITIAIPDFRRLDKEERAKIVQNLSLEVRYDGKQEADLKATLGMLLGMGEFSYTSVKGLSQGADNKGNLYFYLPMPYEKSISVSLVGTEDVLAIDGVNVEVFYETLDANTDFSNIGYLKTQQHVYDVCQEGEPITVLKTAGAGKLVGVVQSLKSADGWGHLEGDEIAYINGSQSHALHGTGTEDFYGGAWYYVGGTFSNEFAGCTVLNTNADNSTENNAYRFLTYDPIYFDNGIDMTIEHGEYNNAKDTYCNILALYYHVEEPLCQLIATDVKTTITDGRSVLDRIVTIGMEGYYRNQITGTVEERMLSGTSEMTIPLTEASEGLLLRRFFSMDNAKQGAAVYVDGQFVGNWINPFHRSSADITRYDDYYIPASYLEGKSSVIISFQTLEGYRWGETSYQVYSYGATMPVEPGTNTPGLTQTPGSSDTDTPDANNDMSWLWILLAIPVAALILVVYYIAKMKQ